ncbi:hypothetical protein PRUPE_2G032400 [Prunus persica]|uniref:Crossover junction endonuclease MUS81 n=1 Tax=Prunus persica TaxID=3760 RepID=M5XMU6_PRUPE|nr:hypothetical protein PRUPE_2G032400 [Prunus persica]
MEKSEQRRQKAEGRRQEVRGTRGLRHGTWIGGKRNKGSRRYLPQKNYVAYALLITLYRGTENVNEFMPSGLSHMPIMSEKGKGKLGHFASSKRNEMFRLFRPDPLALFLVTIYVTFIFPVFVDNVVWCGLKKLMYLVESDPNTSEAAESMETDCFTTEMLEGFDVQRTIGLTDTLKTYAYLTQAITQYYNSEFSEEQYIRAEEPSACPFNCYNSEFSFETDSEKMVNKLYTLLQSCMQVSQLTEEVVIVVLDLYLTLLSLTHAYSLLEGDVCAQEEMLRTQSNNAVNAGASKNIFHLVWGN